MGTDETMSVICMARSLINCIAFCFQDDENCKDDLKARTRLDSHLSNEPNEDEKSEEEEELNDTGSHVPSVSAGSPTSASETPVVTPAGVLQQPEIPPPVEPVVDANVPEVSLLDTKVENKAEAQLTRPSHGFVATGAPSSGSDNGSVGGRGTEAVKEQEHGAAVTPSGACSVKTFANLFKNDLTPSASSGTHEFNRSPFPNKPSTGRLEPSPTGVSSNLNPICSKLELQLWQFELQISIVSGGWYSRLGN